MEISQLIKDLRNKTGAGFLDCKNALSENNNNIDNAIEYLRKKGLAKASKKTSREANEGAIGIYFNDKYIAVLKVNSETDFAAKSETFLNFLDELGKIIINNKKIDLTKEEFLNLKYNNGLVSDYFNTMISTIGENLVLNEIIILENNSSFAFYVHNSYKSNIGKIVSILIYSSEDNNNEINLLSKNLCMHIAAMKPESIDVSDLDKKIIENEKNIQRDLILNSGKPSSIVEKILEGKMNKFYSEVTLLNQKYIIDPEKTVMQIIQEHSKNNKFKVESFKILSM